MSKRSPSTDEDGHDRNFLGYGFQNTKSRKRSTDEDDGDRMKQAKSSHRCHAVRGANVYPLEYFGAPLLAKKFPLSANEKSFLEFTGTSDPKVARQYLDMTEGDLDVAVATYVDQEVPCAPPSALRDENASLVSVSEDLDSNSDEFASSPRANDDAIMLWEKESDDEERFLGITGTSDIDVAIQSVVTPCVAQTSTLLNTLAHPYWLKSSLLAPMRKASWSSLARRIPKWQGSTSI